MEALLAQAPLTKQAVKNYKAARQQNKEWAAEAHKRTAEKTKIAKAGKPGMFNLEKHADWLFPAGPRGLEFKPNARFRFIRGQTVECYDEAGNQTLLVIEKDWKTDGEYSKETVRFKTCKGMISLPNTEVFFIAWLSQIPPNLR